MITGYLCDAQDAYIWTGGRGAIPRPKKTIQHTGNTLHKYSPTETEDSKLPALCFRVC